MDADYTRPSGLSGLSHCFMRSNYSRLIPFQSAQLTHVNRYRWSCTWKLISENLWSLNQRQFFKQSQTQTWTCNRPSTVNSHLALAVNCFCETHSLDLCMRRSNAGILSIPSSFLSLWHNNNLLQFSVNIFGKSFLQFFMCYPAYIHHALHLYSFQH